MVEEALVLIKPDAVRRQLIGLILHEYEKLGLRISHLEMQTATKERVEAHYSKLADKPFFDEIVSSLSSGPLVIVILTGEECIERVRTINGPTDPKEADKSTIRGKYGISLTENTVHASDSTQHAQKEINLWVPKR